MFPLQEPFEGNLGLSAGFSRNSQGGLLEREVLEILRGEFGLKDGDRERSQGGHMEAGLRLL